MQCQNLSVLYKFLSQMKNIFIFEMFFVVNQRVVYSIIKGLSSIQKDCDPTTQLKTKQAILLLGMIL